MTEEVIEEISSGKTYLDQEAKTLSLLDELRGREKSLEIATKSKY